MSNEALTPEILRGGETPARRFDPKSATPFVNKSVSEATSRAYARALREFFQPAGMNCIVDDLLKAVGHTDDRRRVMTDAEVLRTALLAAHRRYFCGVKAQVVTTEGGVPVEFAFLPGSASDVRGLEVLPLALPEDSELFMDSG